MHNVLFDLCAPYTTIHKYSKGQGKHCLRVLQINCEVYLIHCNENAVTNNIQVSYLFNVLKFSF